RASAAGDGGDPRGRPAPGPRRFRLPVREAVEHDLATIAKFQPLDGHLLLAFEGDAAVGTACMRRIEPDTSEIKRMWVQPEYVLAGSVTILPFDEHAAEPYGSTRRTWRRVGAPSPHPT